MLVKELMSAANLSQGQANGFLSTLVKLGAIPAAKKIRMTETQKKPSNKYDLSSLGDFDFDTWRREMQEKSQSVDSVAAENKPELVTT